MDNRRTISHKREAVASVVIAVMAVRISTPASLSSSLFIGISINVMSGLVFQPLCGVVWCSLLIVAVTVRDLAKHERTTGKLILVSTRRG
jgi:hypothetical protein